MDNELEYIEAYFEEQLSETEKQQFEQRCVQDKDFANEVAFYITSRQAIRHQLLQQKRMEWATEETIATEDAISGPAPVRKLTFARWIPYAAAACVILLVAVYFLNVGEAPQQLADKFIHQNYTSLSQNMDASFDSIQQGIAAYNQKDYNQALRYFENYYQSHPDNSEVKQYIGLSFLMKKEYDAALTHFDELSQKQGLQSNPGLFLKALTLLERNKANDKQTAKSLLEKVVAQNLEYSSDASALLKKWK